MSKKNGQPLVYKPKYLIPGYKIEAGLEGFYVAVPDRVYKGKSFIIRYFFRSSTLDDGHFVEIEVPDWNRAVRFRRFMDKWGRGAYTLGYFKVAEKL